LNLRPPAPGTLPKSYLNSLLTAFRNFWVVLLFLPILNLLLSVDAVVISISAAVVADVVSDAVTVTGAFDVVLVTSTADVVACPVAIVVVAVTRFDFPLVKLLALINRRHNPPPAPANNSSNLDTTVAECKSRHLTKQSLKQGDRNRKRKNSQKS